MACLAWKCGEIGAILGSNKLKTPGVKDLALGALYSELTVGVPREIYPGERRVAQTPGKFCPPTWCADTKFMLKRNSRLSGVARRVCATLVRSRVPRRAPQVDVTVPFLIRTVLCGCADTVAKLVSLGFQVNVEAGAGAASGFTDDMVRVP
jgi:hypothetical protein